MANKTNDGSGDQASFSFKFPTPEFPDFRLIVLDLNDKWYAEIITTSHCLIQNAKTSVVDFNNYMDFLLKQLVMNHEDFMKVVNKKTTEIDIYFLRWVAYEILVDVYPYLGLDFLLRVDRASVSFKSLIKSLKQNTPGEIPTLAIDLEDIHPDHAEDLQGFIDKISDEMYKPQDPKKNKKTKKKAQKKAVTKTRNFTTKSELSIFERYLKNNLIGQDEAITSLINRIKIMSAGLCDRAAFFFLGPTGVGKTQLARLTGGKYGQGMIKINCGEYSKSHEYSKLIGSPPGYIGHSDKNFLSGKAEIGNNWVFVFDEIEKADDKLFDILLNLLDEGTIDDSTGRTLDFKKSMFIFTSNNSIKDTRVGQTQVGFDKSVITFAMKQDEIVSDLKKTFAPEFLNRLDEVIIFNPLSKRDILKIIDLELKCYPINTTKSMEEAILSGAYSEEYGAREVSRYIKKTVALVLADAILEEQAPNTANGYYNMSFIGGKYVVLKPKKKQATRKKRRDQTIDEILEAELEEDSKEV